MSRNALGSSDEDFLLGIEDPGGEEAGHVRGLADRLGGPLNNIPEFQDQQPNVDLTLPPGVVSETDEHDSRDFPVSMKTMLDSQTLEPESEFLKTILPEGSVREGQMSFGDRPPVEFGGRQKGFSLLHASSHEMAGKSSGTGPIGSPVMKSGRIPVTASRPTGGSGGPLVIGGRMVGMAPIQAAEDDGIELDGEVEDEDAQNLADQSQSQFSTGTDGTDAKTAPVNRNAEFEMTAAVNVAMNVTAGADKITVYTDGGWTHTAGGTIAAWGLSLGSLAKLKVPAELKAHILSKKQRITGSLKPTLLPEVGNLYKKADGTLMRIVAVRGDKAVLTDTKGQKLVGSVSEMVDSLLVEGIKFLTSAATASPTMSTGPSAVASPAKVLKKPNTEPDDFDSSTGEVMMSDQTKSLEDQEEDQEFDFETSRRQSGPVQGTKKVKAGAVKRVVEDLQEKLSLEEGREISFEEALWAFHQGIETYKGLPKGPGPKTSATIEQTDKEDGAKPGVTSPAARPAEDKYKPASEKMMGQSLPKPKGKPLDRAENLSLTDRRSQDLYFFDIEGFNDWEQGLSDGVPISEIRKKVEGKKTAARRERPEPPAIRVQFKSQALKDLWDKEIIGQLSDGAWEHDPRTDWLWANSTSELGPLNIILMPAGAKKGRSFFPDMYDELEPVHDRMKEITGFDDQQLKSACHIIGNMIRFPAVDTTPNPTAEDVAVDEAAEKSLNQDMKEAMSSKKTAANEIKLIIDGQEVSTKSDPAGTNLNCFYLDDEKYCFDPNQIENGKVEYKTWHSTGDISGTATVVQASLKKTAAEAFSPGTYVLDVWYGNPESKYVENHSIEYKTKPFQANSEDELAARVQEELRERIEDYHFGDDVMIEELLEEAGPATAQGIEYDGQVFVHITPKSKSKPARKTSSFKHGQEVLVSLDPVNQPKGSKKVTAAPAQEMPFSPPVAEEIRRVDAWYTLFAKNTAKEREKGEYFIILKPNEDGFYADRVPELRNAFESAGFDRRSGAWAIGWGSKGAPGSEVKALKEIINIIKSSLPAEFKMGVSELYSEDAVPRSQRRAAQYMLHFNFPTETGKNSTTEIRLSQRTSSFKHGQEVLVSLDPVRSIIGYAVGESEDGSLIAVQRVSVFKAGGKDFETFPADKVTTLPIGRKVDARLRRMSRQDLELMSLDPSLPTHLLQKVEAVLRAQAAPTPVPTSADPAAETEPEAPVGLAGTADAATDAVEALRGDMEQALGRPVEFDEATQELKKRQDAAEQAQEEAMPEPRKAASLRRNAVLPPKPPEMQTPPDGMQAMFDETTQSWNLVAKSALRTAESVEEVFSKVSTAIDKLRTSTDPKIASQVIEKVLAGLTETLGGDSEVVKLLRTKLKAAEIETDPQNSTENSDPHHAQNPSDPTNEDQGKSSTLDDQTSWSGGQNKGASLELPVGFRDAGLRLAQFSDGYALGGATFERTMIPMDGSDDIEGTLAGIEL